MFPITDSYTYLALLFFIAGVLKFAESNCAARRLKLFFNYLPAVVCLYVITMLLGSVGCWDAPSVAKAGNLTNSYILPPLIFLLLLKSDLREIVKLGPRMSAVFVLAALTMMIGFAAAFVCFGRAFPENSWKPLAALCGSWVGGAVNMAAIKEAVNVPESDMGYVLAIDTVAYSIWLLLMLLAFPFARIFNRWTGADGSRLEETIRRAQASADGEDGKEKAVTFANLIFLSGLAAMAGAVSFGVGDFLAGTLKSAAGNNPLLAGAGEPSLWRVLAATILGIMLGMTKIGKLAGTSELGNTLLYFFIAVMGAKVDLRELDFSVMALYVAFGFTVLAIHFGLLAGCARLFKFDAFSCQTASLANIGGVASATIISGFYSPALVPVGVLMATLGTILGTGCGLLTAKAMELLSSVI